MNPLAVWAEQSARAGADVAHVSLAFAAEAQRLACTERVLATKRSATYCTYGTHLMCTMRPLEATHVEPCAHLMQSEVRR